MTLNFPSKYALYKKVFTKTGGLLRWCPNGNFLRPEMMKPLWRLSHSAVASQNNQASLWLYLAIEEATSPGQVAHHARQGFLHRFPSKDEPPDPPKLLG